MKLLLSLSLALSLHSATVVYVQCGSGNSATDFGFAGGASYATGYPTVPYDHERYSNPAATPFTYSFNVPAAVYNVVLGFIETSRTGPNQRKFDIVINGNTVITGLDVWAAAGGALKPYVTTVQIPSTGIMSLRFTPTAPAPGVPIAAAIVSSITVSTPDQPPPIGLPPGMSWDGTTLKISGHILATGYDLPPGSPLVGFGTPMPASKVGLPATGAVIVFADSENANKITRKDWNGKLFVVEGNPINPPPVNPIEHCVDTLFPVTQFQRRGKSTSSAADILTIPANVQLLSAWIFEDTLVTAKPTVTAVSAWIGTKGTPYIFAGPFQLMGVNIPPYRQYPANSGLAVTSNTSQLVQLTLGVTGGPGDLSDLAAGVVKTRVCTLDTTQPPSPPRKK